MSDGMDVSFLQALEMIEEEKGISKEALIEAIETALTSAYKKSYGVNQNIVVEINKSNGGIEIYTKVFVVEEIEDENTEMTLEEAREIDERYEIGDVVEYHIEPGEFSRIAAQTAKQVVVQKIREMERSMIFDDFIERQGSIVNGQIQRISNGTIFISIGKTEGLLSEREQVPGENFKTGEFIKVFVIDVRKTTKGPQVFVSRSHPALVTGLFEMEVPEIEEGIVEIKSVAREQGSRTKMAVWANDENVDAIGACVGAKGNRVESVTREIFGEKIDIINWSNDPAELITSALSPASVEEVIIRRNKEATVVVPDMQLSLAIGKAGQNVRLAAKLCSWKIDIKSRSQFEEMLDDPEQRAIFEEQQILEEPVEETIVEEFAEGEEFFEEVAEESEVASEGFEEVVEESEEDSESFEEIHEEAELENKE